MDAIKNSYITPENDTEINIVDIIRFFWKYRIIIIISTFITISVSVTYCFFSREIFSTQTLFIIKTNNSSNTNLSSIASLAGISLGSNSNTDPSDYIDKVIQDQIFLSKVLDQKWNFKGDSLYFHQIWNLKKDTLIPDWQFRFKMNNLNFIRDQKFFIINKDKKNGILSLIVKAPDPMLAYDMNIFIIDKISDYIRNSIQSQAKEKRLFIEKRINEVKVDLENCENALASFKERNISSISPNVMLEEMRLTRDVTMNQELYIQFQKQYQLALVEEKDDQTILQIIKNPEIPLFRTAPKKKQIVIFGFMVGIFAGVIVSYFYHLIKMKNSFKLIQSTKNNLVHKEEV